MIQIGQCFRSLKGTSGTYSISFVQSPYPRLGRAGRGARVAPGVCVTVGTVTVSVVVVTVFVKRVKVLVVVATDAVRTMRVLVVTGVVLDVSVTVYVVGLPVTVVVVVDTVS